MADSDVVSAGQRLVESLNSGLDEDREWSERDLAILDLIERTADRIEQLEAVIAEQGVMTTGSRGQVAVHPAVQESRYASADLARHLDRLVLPPDDEGEEKPKSFRHQRAVASRWSRARVGVGG